MGIAVSKEQCWNDYKIEINCTFFGSDNSSNATIKLPPYESMGGFSRGEVPGDPDVGGIVILGTFLGVTCFSIFVALLYLIWTGLKASGLKPTWSDEDKLEKHKGTVVSFSGILEAIILCSSDQQFFTGAAYGVALRYWRRCVVSAYHYNLISSMLLLSCATHILAVAVVRQYFRHKTLAILRICCVACFLAMTATFMINTNAKTELRFPTTVPMDKDNSLMFLPAACFQTEDSLVKETLYASVETPNAFFDKTILQSAPEFQKLQGWRWYVCFVLYYGFTLIPSTIRVFRLIAKKLRKTDGEGIPQGGKGRWGHFLEKLYGRQTKSRRLFQWLFCGYLTIGLAFSIGATFQTANFIFGLRKWAHESGWMEEPLEEADKTTFGQLVTALSCTYIAFGVLQVISDRRSQAEDGKKLRNSTIENLNRRSTIDVLSPGDKSNDVYYGSHDARDPKTQSGYFAMQAITPGAESTMPLNATPKWPASRMSSYNMHPFIPSPDLGLGQVSPPGLGQQPSPQVGSVHNSPQMGRRTSSYAGSAGSAPGARPVSIVQEGSAIGLASFHRLSSASNPNFKEQTATIVSVSSDSGNHRRGSNESDRTVKNGTGLETFDSPGPIGSPAQGTGLGFFSGTHSSYMAVPNLTMTPETMPPADVNKSASVE